MNDIRFAFRKLRQSPAFTSIAVITLALGIGLNTAIFSLVNDLFLRGLPFKEPARVVHFFGGDKSRDLEDLPVSAPRFEHFRDGQTICESLAGENFFAFTLTGLGDPVQVFGGRLTSNYFDVLGVRPILGRVDACRVRGWRKPPWPVARLHEAVRRTVREGAFPGRRREARR